MNNMKIKSYSLKKTPTSVVLSTVHQLGKGVGHGNSYLQTERKKEGNIINSNFNIEKEKSPGLPSEVDKIIKSPGLNISSRLDGKGKTSIYIYL
jgi:hypothetical protein